jgi:hypothetical protein
MGHEGFLEDAYTTGSRRVQYPLGASLFSLIYKIRKEVTMKKYRILIFLFVLLAIPNFCGQEI